MPKAHPLFFEDAPLGAIDLPGGVLALTHGLGSGLAIRANDPPGTVWAIGDRGPNLKVKLAVERYGLDHLRTRHAHDGAKVMPRTDIGPAIAELRLTADGVSVARLQPLRGRSGRPISGLPTPGGAHAANEPAIALNGQILAPDPSGADTEGIVACADGGFWVGDEYGPSLLRISRDGVVTTRWVPAGLDRLFEGADYPVVGALPPIAARRRLNRGFEALALSPDERWLYLCFQSPLAHPDRQAHEQALHTRIWKMDATTGAVAAQFLYPFDKPETFRRDRAKDELKTSDLKVSEMVLMTGDTLLILERGSETTKLYLTTLAEDREVPSTHMDSETRPTLEELSAAREVGNSVPELEKALVLTTDDLPEVGADLEGLVVLSPRELLLVNDNDFGIEGRRTRFWRIELDRSLPLQVFSSGL